MKSAQARRARRHIRIRKKISGTAERPRLAVYRSNRHIYVQLIDDLSGRTVASASTVEKALSGQKGLNTLEGASKVGELVAERAAAAGVTTAVFDRGGFKFHGKVKALADSAREKGLQF